MVSKALLAVQEDLFFTVKIADGAKRAGLTAIFVKTEAAAMECLAARPLIVVVDLNLKAVDPVQLIRRMKSGEFSGIPVIGYVSHVQVELKQKALEAGCDAVFARSVFSSALAGILGRYAGLSVDDPPGE